MLKFVVICVKSHSNYPNFVLFRDNYSHIRLVNFMKDKSEVPEKLEIVLNQIKVNGFLAKELILDNSGQIYNTKIQKMLNPRGIIHMLTVPYI